MAAGFVLNIPNEMLNRLDEADRKIEQLEQTASKTADSVVQSFLRMKTAGVDAFISSLNGANRALANLNQIQAQGSGLQNIGVQANNSVDEVHLLIASIYQLMDLIESGKGGKNKTKLIDTDGDYKRLADLERELSELQTIKKRGGSDEEGALDEARERALVNEIYHLKELIKWQNMSDEQRAASAAKAEAAAERAARATAKQRQAEKDAIYSSPVGALNFESQAKTIGDYKQALDYLLVARDQLDTKDALYIDRLNDINVAIQRTKAILKDATLTDQERADAAVAAADKAVRAAKREQEAYERRKQSVMSRWYSSSDTRALSFSENASSINQRTEAIKYLKIARDNLLNTDSRYEQRVNSLNTEIRRQQTEVDRLRGKSDELHKSHRNLMDISGQLARKLALLFSVSQMTGYFNKLIQVRGELELQQRSLQAMLQSKREADELWNKTIQLAVQSPYQIKELVTYTKQLAAYRVESEKLYDTTKMLADISSGLGVDMQRLILAYGQVKAANYLRGTELRQFSEAGVNILEELSMYFTELEGSAVSVADVFDRVSRRLVRFEDVEQIFKRLTAEGGTFYRMQEIQAETLRGQVSNLKDSITVMLNDIGTANEKSLKNMVALARVIIENWEVIPPLLLSIISALSIAKVAAVATKDDILLNAIDLGILTNAAQKQLSLWQLFQVAMKQAGQKLAEFRSGLVQFIGLNAPLMAMLVALAAVGYGIKDIISYNKELKEIADTFAKLRKPVQDLGVSFTQSVWDANLKKARTELTQLISLAQREYDLKIDLAIEDINDMDLAQVEAAFEAVRQRVLNANRLAEDFATAMAEAQQKQQWFLGDASAISDMSVGQMLWEGSLGGLFDTNWNTMQKDLEQYGTTATKVFALIRAYGKDAANAVLALEDALTDSQRQAVKNLTTAQERNETEAMYFARISEAYQQLQPLFNAVGYQNNKLERQMAKLGRRAEEVRREFESFNVYLDESWSDQEKTEYLRVAIDRFAFDNDYNDFQKYLLQKLAEEKFYVPIIPQLETEVASTESAEWAKRVSGAISEINENIKAEAAKQNMAISESWLFPVPKAGEEQTEFLTRAAARIREVRTEFTKTQQLYTDTEVTIMEFLSNYADKVEGVLNITSKTNAENDKGNSIWSERLSLIKDIAAEYKNLSQHLSVGAVDEAIIRKYQRTWETTFASFGKDITDFQWDTATGVEAAFDFLIRKTADVSERTKLMLEKETFKLNMQVELSEENLDQLKSDIDALFDQYKVGVDLQKLGITEDMARAFFGLDSLSLDSLRHSIQSVEEDFQQSGKNGVEAYNDYLQKVSKLEKEAQMERLKQYLAYSRASIGERTKIKLEEMRKLQDIEKTFIAKPTATAAELAQWERAKLKAQEGVRKEAAAKLQEYDWKEFQKTETFIHIMEDLENASDSALSSMIQQLESFRDQWTDMPVDQMKQIVDLIQKMEEARLDKLNPFGGARSLRRQIAADGRDMETAEMDMLQAEQTLRAYQNQLSVYEAINQKRAEGATNEQLIAYFGQEYAGIIEAGQPALDAQLAIIRRNREQQDKIVKSAKDQIDAINRLNDLYKKQGDYYRMLLGMAQDLYGAFESLYEALGGDDDALGKVFADAGMQIMTSVLNTLALEVELKNATVQAGTLAAAMNAAAGVVGWIVMAVQILASILSAVFKAHDKGLENQIEHITERVENLQKHYEKLEEAIDKAYSTEQLAAYTKQLESTAKVQIAAIRSMIALEEAKKSVDEDRIEDWEKQIEDLEANLADALRDAVSTATDGILDDTLGTARDFVDAWYEAFSEVGDGLSGLQDNFQEMLANLVQQQATMQIAGKFLDRWKTYLGEYINEDDLELTTEEAQAFAARVKAELPELSAALEAFFSTMYDTIDGAAGGVELSGLQKGISSITEETAQILEAYLNSIRFYVADSNAKLAQIVASWANPEVENPIVSNLRIIAKQTSDIHTLLDSLTAPHPTEAGRGLKVII